MDVYTYSEAREKLASLLDEACRRGEVRIRRRDGQMFVLKPATEHRSPLDVPGIDLGLNTEEIVSLVREGRERAVVSEPSKGWRKGKAPTSPKR